MKNYTIHLVCPYCHKGEALADADSPQFEILLFAYAFDEEPTEIVDIACGEQLPQRVLDALEDTSIVKTAFNAQFERTCIPPMSQAA